MEKNRNKKFNNKQKERMKNPLTDRRRKEKRMQYTDTKNQGKLTETKKSKYNRIQAQN